MKCPYRGTMKILRLRKSGSLDSIVLRECVVWRTYE